MLRLDACGNTRVDLRLPLAVEFHLPLTALLFQPCALLLPHGAFTRKLLLRDLRAVHGTLVVNFEVDVQNGIQILVVNRLLARLIVRLRLLAIDLGQTLLLALELHARRDNDLCVLLPDRILKRRRVSLWRLDLRRLR